jgi:hypothetical protein
VERVAAPLTTFLVGIAVGRGAALGSTAATATALLMDHESSGTPRGTEARSADDASG